MNILFVCLGNICRSPMAAGIMRRLYSLQHKPGIIESAGTADWNLGRPADQRAIAVAAEHGIDISSHRARQVRRNDFQRFDRIFALDRQNQTALHKLAPLESLHKIILLGGDQEIADPYSGDMELFRATYKLIEEGCLSALTLL